MQNETESADRSTGNKIDHNQTGEFEDESVYLKIDLGKQSKESLTPGKASSGYQNNLS